MTSPSSARILGAVAAILLLCGGAAHAQLAVGGTTGAAGGASEIEREIRRQPTLVQIQERFLAMRQARLERNLRQELRCVDNARQRLRDISGRVNRAASIDIRNCGRRARQIVRQLARLGRSGERMAFEVAGETAVLQARILGGLGR